MTGGSYQGPGLVTITIMVTNITAGQNISITKHISDHRVRFSWDILVVTTLNQSMVRSSAVRWGCGHTLVNVGESLLTSTLLEVSHQVTRMVNPLTI